MCVAFACNLLTCVLACLFTWLLGCLLVYGRVCACFDLCVCLFACLFVNINK